MSSTLPDDLARLRDQIEWLGAEGAEPEPTVVADVVDRLRAALRTGRVRSAQPGPGGWTVTPWVKTGILVAFREGANAEYKPFQEGERRSTPWRWFDKDLLPLLPSNGLQERFRVVPGGTSIRDGAYVGPGVVVMPPAFINIGAYVDEGAMIDSHALVGSCAQVGKRVHLSAGAQLGGVLEPIGLRPVIVEDDVLVAGNAGIFEGTLVGRGAVVGPGVQLTRATPVYDLVRDTIYRATPDEPLTIPPGAVVVPGSRPARGPMAEREGLHLYAPVIVKYRDSKTDAATALEELLR